MGLQVELYPHQVVCRDWLREKEHLQGGGVLSLNMGLGKTVIGFSLINQEDPLPTLVFCPVGLLHQWKFECEDKTDFRCFIFHGKSRTEFAEKFDEMRPHVVLASFGSARDKQLHSRHWHRIIVDEIHYIRNIRTIVFKALCQYEAKYRIGLTGTPLVNGPFDLFSYCLFLKVLDVPMFAKGTTMDKKSHLFLKKQFSFRLDRGLMRQIMLQMSLQDCSMEVALTPYHETLHELNLEKVELGIYKRLEERVSKNVAAAHHTEEQSNSHMMLLSYIVYLRQAANDLYLVRGQLASDPDYEEEIMQTGAKTAKCVELVSKVSSTEKIIVFSEFLGMMNVIGKALSRLDIPHLFYVGGMTIQERSACIADFQKHQGKIVLIAMKQCISVGLNLTQANHVILLSEWWNFTLDRQCIARIHRLGQTKPVYVHKLMSKATIDERIRQIAANKEQEISTAASYSNESKHADKYLKQTSLADYGYLLNLSE